MAPEQWMLDTSIVIHFFKGHGGVAERLLAVPPRSVAVPAVVAYELSVGVQKSVRRAEREAQLQRFLQLVGVVPFGEAEAKVAATVRAELERTGSGIGPLDTLIAATAVAHGATLVTNNTRKFERVEGLQLVDWCG